MFSHRLERRHWRAQLRNYAFYSPAEWNRMLSSDPGRLSLTLVPGPNICARTAHAVRVDSPGNLKPVRPICRRCP
eukprot:9443435-Pyramimonas_sp.AAC.1